VTDFLEPWSSLIFAVITIISRSTQIFRRMGSLLVLVSLMLGAMKINDSAGLIQFDRH
jgi:hypothetical protein